MTSLRTDLVSFRAETDRLLALLSSTSDLAPTHRKLIAEIVLLRLGILIENHLRFIFSKVVSGAGYLDGTRPKVLIPQRSMSAAISAMRTLNRNGKERALPWNDGAGIRDNLEHLVDRSDPCMTVMINYASFLTEVRSLRNHVAHKNDGTRRNFVKVLRKYYGASVRGVTCGGLLLSPRVHNPPLIEIHIKTARVMLKDLVRE